MKKLLLLFCIPLVGSLTFPLILINKQGWILNFQTSKRKIDRSDEKSHVYSEDGTEITQIGFYKRNNLITIKQIPPTVKKVSGQLPTEIQSLYGAFANRNSNSGQKVTGFENWDTSKVTDMSYVFSNNHLFDADISKWKTNNVTKMDGMFKNASKFNNGDKPLDWDTSNVTSMESMFDGATSFSQSLKKWKVEKVTKNKNFSRGSGIFGNNDKKPNWNGLEEVNDPIEKKIEKKPEVIIHPSPTSPKRKVQIPIVKLVSPIIKPKPLANSTSKLNIPKSTMTQNQTSKKLSTPAIVGIVVGTQAVLTSLGFGIPYIIKRFKK
ncbi:BspA family leucine-rich repeat surface protein [Mycoplasma feriruminatoris]|uniref:Uncharacterized protein n=1 Tax=Mycoplasma feriruminatoris TaxID=1179777 RepID=A0A654IN54_9MOLU|nr:hypothetical protein MF5583_00122 [Mycoplasma feriruminatoris]